MPNINFIMFYKAKLFKCQSKRVGHIENVYCFVKFFEKIRFVETIFLLKAIETRFSIHSTFKFVKEIEKNLIFFRKKFFLHVGISFAAAFMITVFFRRAKRRDNN